MYALLYYISTESYWRLKSILNEEWGHDNFKTSQDFKRDWILSNHTIMRGKVKKRRYIPLVTLSGTALIIVSVKWNNQSFLAILSLGIFSFSLKLISSWKKTFKKFMKTCKNLSKYVITNYWLKNYLKITFKGKTEKNLLKFHFSKNSKLEDLNFTKMKWFKILYLKFK